MHILFLEFYSSDPMPNYPELAKVHRLKGNRVWLGCRTREGNLQWHDGEKVICTQPGPAKSLGRTSISFLRPIFRRIGHLKFMWNVRKFIRENNPDVVHVNQASLFYIFLLPLFMSHDILFIMDVRQPGEWESSGLIARIKNWRQRKRLWFNARFFFDHTCFMAEAAAHRILGRNWRRWASVQRIAVDKGFLDVLPVHEGKGMGETKVRFLFVGTLGRTRRLEHLLYSAQILSRKTKSFELHLMGPEASEGYYPALISELGIEDVVKILPPVAYSQVPGVIADYDVALAYVRSTADWRYQPTLKVVEYRAAGIPIIASDNPPNRELVAHGENGLLAKDSPEAFAEAMERFVVDRPFLMACGENANKSRIRRTWVDVAEQYEREVYAPFFEGKNL